MKKVTTLVAAAMMTLSPVAFAQCELDYNINLRIAYSKSSFDVKSHQQRDKYEKTHNNASRIGGNLAYSCGDVTLKYTHHSVIDWTGENDLKSKKIISTYTLSHPRYGSFTAGKMTTPYKAAGKNGDPFWDTATGTVFAANNFGFSALTRGFSNDTYVYSAPKLGNFQFKLGYSGENSHGDYHHGLEYQLTDGVVGVQYLNMGSSSYVANGKDVQSAVRVYGRHSFNDYLLTGSVERVRTENSQNETFYNISLQKDVADFGRWAVSYGHVSDVRTKLINGWGYQGDGDGLTAGVFYDWAQNSEVYLLTSLLDFEGDTKQNSLILGFNYHFNL